MNIHIGLVTYAIDVTPLVETADPHGGIIWNIFQHSMNSEVNDAVDRLHEEHRVRVHPERTNRGLARSWNQFIIDAQMMKADVMIVANDDIMATLHDILALAQACLDHPECGIITAWGFNERMGDVRDNGYSLFGINPIAVETVGYFDENFLVIYHEDSDYSKRLALAGIPFHSCAETNIFHKGSATIASVPELNRQNNITFQTNNAYFVRKWGGQPGSETFTRPFDDPQFDLKITAEQRRAPYPGYNRTDHDIVKI